MNAIKRLAAILVASSMHRPDLLSIRQCDGEVFVHSLLELKERQPPVHILWTVPSLPATNL